jgi:hypothetical protein
VAKYSADIDNDSAFEMLTAKLQDAENKGTTTPGGTGKQAKPELSTFEKIANNTIVKRMVRTAGNGIVRSILGVLGMGGRSGTSAKKSWF